MILPWESNTISYISSISLEPPVADQFVFADLDIPIEFNASICPRVNSESSMILGFGLISSAITSIGVYFAIGVANESSRQARIPRDNARRMLLRNMSASSKQRLDAYQTNGGREIVALTFFLGEATIITSSPGVTPEM